MGVKRATAKTILKRSVADIEAGNWCQGEIGRRNGTSTACAVGLLSMHGDFGRQMGKWFIPYYPNENAPAGVLAALETLYGALPRKWRSRWSLKGLEIGERVDAMSQAVIEYNDQPTTKREKAAKWFKKALEAA